MSSTLGDCNYSYKPGRRTTQIPVPQNVNGTQIEYSVFKNKLTKLNSVALGSKQNIPTERPPLAGGVCVNFTDRRCHVVSATDPTAVNLDFPDPEPLLFHSSSS
jgi:hypothetical protein